MASRSGVKFCARPDRCVVSNFKGYTSCKTSWNQLSPSSCEASCNPPSCAAPCQLQIARAVKFLPAATSRQILIVHGSCKPAVKFLYQLQLRQAATLVKFYEGKPAGSFIFYIYKNPILLYHKLKRKSNFNRIPHNTESRKI